jgi:hypothetical protein
MNGQSQAVPPKIASRSPLTFFAVTVLAAAIIGATAVLFFFNPATHRFYPICMFHQLTGWNCPGCGATRALYALLHGNFAMAIRDNALVVFTLAFFLVWLARFTFKKNRGEKTAFDLSPKILWVFLITAIVFAICRNLPAFQWLSP